MKAYPNSLHAYRCAAPPMWDSREGGCRGRDEGVPNAAPREPGMQSNDGISLEP
jgi:hypothetical protein